MGTIQEVFPKKAHVLAIPLPGQGHINPMLQFCRILATNYGIKITLLLTNNITKSMQYAPTNSLINIETISDGTEESNIQDNSVVAFFKQFQSKVSPSLVEIIEKKKKSSQAVNILLYDSVIPWALDIAKEYGLFGVSFFTQSCSVTAVYYHMMLGTMNNDDSLVSSVPNFPLMGTKDLPSFSYFKDYSKDVMLLLLNQFSNIQEVDWALFNTFDKLEEEVVKWMASKWPIKTIGPLIPSTYLTKTHNDNGKEDSRIHLFKPDYESCMKWLHERDDNSVIYVSFGSAAGVEQEQMEELAYALKEINQYFLWVVRDSEEHKLPKDFKSESLEKGLIVKWCNQLDILNHKAIACFLTHCGWNSTLEALSMGLPMIAIPQFVDQMTHAKFIEDVWKVGIRPKLNKKEIVTREEISTCIDEVVHGKRGKEFKRNALKWKDLAKQSMFEGGNSRKTIEEFISKVTSL
ncbi:UDP glycosyltransferase 9-like [Lycium barbarum]|uniref:UDP glycosyltransferase 9-like n=1 Tax=Lycium barbarum TaxID=112863 RepID=UPI00293EC44D|nr:UDP glycosyltransferase 9-like [Lycium barbarum]